MLRSHLTHQTHGFGMLGQQKPYFSPLFLPLAVLLHGVARLRRQEAGDHRDPVRGPEETEPAHSGVNFLHTRHGKRHRSLVCLLLFGRLNTGVSANWAYLQHTTPRALLVGACLWRWPMRIRSGCVGLPRCAACAGRPVPAGRPGTSRAGITVPGPLAWCDPKVLLRMLVVGPCALRLVLPAPASRPACGAATGRGPLRAAAASPAVGVRLGTLVWSGFLRHGT